MAKLSNQHGMACPECGASDQIDVVAQIWVRLVPDGTDADKSWEGSHEWDDASPCRCNACQHFGTVETFTKQQEDSNNG